MNKACKSEKLALPVSRQRGAVLVVSLIILLMLTVIGLSAVRDTAVQERMAGNIRDTNSAFQSAELSLRHAEDYLTLATVGPFTGSNGLYKVCGPGQSGAACNIPDWKNRNSTGWVTVNVTLEGVSRQPQYYIEENPVAVGNSGSLVSDTPNETFEMYRITARGFGSSDGSIIVLQSTYRRG